MHTVIVFDSVQEIVEACRNCRSTDAEPPKVYLGDSVIITVKLEYPFDEIKFSFKDSAGYQPTNFEVSAFRQWTGLDLIKAFLFEYASTNRRKDNFIIERARDSD